MIKCGYLHRPCCVAEPTCEEIRELVEIAIGECPTEVELETVYECIGSVVTVCTLDCVGGYPTSPEPDEHNVGGCDRTGDGKVTCDDLKDFIEDGLACRGYRCGTGSGCDGPGGAPGGGPGGPKDEGPEGGMSKIDHMIDLMCYFFQQAGETGCEVTDSGGTPLTCQDLLACVLQIMADCTGEMNPPSLTPEQMRRLLACMDCEWNCSLYTHLNCNSPQFPCSNQPPGSGGSDYDGDGDVDATDLAIFEAIVRGCCVSTNPAAGLGGDCEGGVCVTAQGAGTASTSGPRAVDVFEGYFCTDISGSYKCYPTRYYQTYGDTGDCPPLIKPEEEQTDDSGNEETDGDQSDQGDCEESKDQPEADSPVQLATGFKIETETDLIVRLRGRDWSLHRSYTSSPVYTGSSLLGARWTANVFRFAAVPDSSTVIIDGGTQRGKARFVVDSGDADLYLPVGASSQYVRRVEDGVTIDSTDYDILRWVEPGSIVRDYFDPADGTTGDLAGLLHQERDVYGNTWTYEYSLWGSGGSKAARLVRINLNGTSQQDAEAFIQFFWNVDSDQTALYGKVMGIVVARRTGTDTFDVTNEVWYTYKISDDDSDGFSTDVGSPGDLIMVVRRTHLDHSPVGSAPVREQITQYRYHSEEDTTPLDPYSDGEVAGLDHQLKMVIKPEQIEYATQQQQRHVEINNPSTAKPRAEAHRLWAEHFLTLDDDETAYSDAVSTPFDLYRIAAKIVSYEIDDESADEGKVRRQYIQAGCGCGGSQHGLRLDYGYHHWTRNSLNGSGLDGLTTKIAESVYDETVPSFVDHRILYHDLEYLGGGTVPYLVTKAIEDNSGQTSRVWVTTWQYSDTGNANASERNVFREHTPSATGTYTPVQLTGSTVTAAPAYTAASSAGLVIQYGRTDDNRVSTVGVRNGTSGGLNVISKITYDGTRPWLPVTVERVRTAGQSSVPGTADDVETTSYAYGFHSGDAIQWIKTTVEAETVGENGPGGNYETVAVYDQYGQNTWNRAADNSLTKLEFNASHGSVESITRNSSATGLPTLTGLSTTGWGTGTTGGSLTTTYEHDLLGRLTERTSPSGVSSFTVRLMRSVSSRPGIYYYAELSLPHFVGTESSVKVFDGPANVRWLSAGGSVVASSDYLLSETAAYAPESLDYTLQSMPSRDGSLALTEFKHLLSGLVIERKDYPNAENPTVQPAYLSSYQHDKLGRVIVAIDPNGTRTEYAYDVLGRVIEVKVGTDTGNMTVVATNYFDEDPDAVTPSHDGVGNGNLTISERPVSSTESRRYDRFYDFRDRLIGVRGPVSPFEIVEYDNLDRATRRAVYDVWPTPPAIDTDESDRGVLIETQFGQRGMPVRTRLAIDATDSTPDWLQTDHWYDSVGRTIATRSPNSPVSKMAYDSLSRPTAMYVTDGRDDPAPGASGSHAAAGDVSGDLVFEQVEYTYTSIDRVSLVTSRVRNHDALGSTPTTGALTTSISVATNVGHVYDSAARRVRTVNFGTNNASDQFANGSSLPSWPPGSTPDWDTSGYEDWIVTGVAYNERGLLKDVIDPLGRRTRVLYDDLSRRIATIENYEDAVVEMVGFGETYSVISGIEQNEPDTDRVTSLLYDGVGNVVAQVAHLRNHEDTTPHNQITRYVYGTDRDTGSIDYSDTALPASRVASNSLLRLVSYPDDDDGDAGTDPAAKYRVHYAYNAQGELVAVTDQNGTRHFYERDDAARVIRDDVMIVGSVAKGNNDGVSFDIDGRVRSLELEYDSFGRVSAARSRTATGGSGTVLNAVGFTYTSLWQIAQVEQDVDSDLGASVASATPRPTRTVGYVYTTSDAAADNLSRLNQLTYPDGSTVDWRYDDTANDLISRADGLDLTDGVGTLDLVRYHYLGTGMFAGVDYPEPDVQLDRTLGVTGLRRLAGYTTQSSGVYPGLDRFGRVKRQAWVGGGLTTYTPSMGSPQIDRPPVADEFYTYDNASNRTSKRIYDLAPGRDWLYAYDQLDRLTSAKRGRVTFNGTTGLPEIGSGDFSWGSHIWELDLLGNWKKFRIDSAGTPDGTFTDTSDFGIERTHNSANEIGEIDIKSPSTSPPNLPFAYDHAGNMVSTEIPGGAVMNRYVHDAWNRLVRVIRLVKNDSPPPTCDPETIYEEFIEGTMTDHPPGYVIAEYDYNPLHWRVRKVSADDPTLDCPVDNEDTDSEPLRSILSHRRDMYYDASWRLIHEEIDDGYDATWTTTDPFVVDRVGQIVWGVRYIDDAVLRRIARGPVGSGGAIDDDTGDPSLAIDWDVSGHTARWWYLTDVQFSVTALISGTTPTIPTERVSYTPYGAGRWIHPADRNADGVVDLADLIDYMDAWNPQLGGKHGGMSQFADDPASGSASGDFNRDGTVDLADLLDFNAPWQADLGLTNPVYEDPADPNGGGGGGWISRRFPTSDFLGNGSPGSATLGPDNPIGYCGYVFNPETLDYTVRFRHYSPRLGRWLERDPAGYIDGMNLQQYALASPVAWNDPSGLVIEPLYPIDEEGRPLPILRPEDSNSLPNDPVLDAIEALFAWASNASGYTRCMLQCAVLEMTDEDIDIFINEWLSDPDITNLLTDEMIAEIVRRGVGYPGMRIVQLHQIVKLMQGRGVAGGLLITKGVKRAGIDLARNKMIHKFRNKLTKRFGKAAAKLGGKWASRAIPIGWAGLAVDACVLKDCHDACSDDHTYSWNEVPFLDEWHGYDVPYIGPFRPGEPQYEQMIQKRSKSIPSDSTPASEESSDECCDSNAAES